MPASRRRGIVVPVGATLALLEDMLATLEVDVPKKTELAVWVAVDGPLEALVALSTPPSIIDSP